MILYESHVNDILIACYSKCIVCGPSSKPSVSPLSHKRVHTQACGNPNAEGGVMDNHPYLPKSTEEEPPYQNTVALVRQWNAV